MLCNKRLNQVVTELFIRGRKLNISLIFITQLYFVVPQILDEILLTILLGNKRDTKFQTNVNFNIPFNHSSDIYFRDFMNLYKNVLQNHFLFYLLVLLFHQIISYVLEKLLWKEYKN